MHFVKISLIISLFTHGLHLSEDVHLSIRKPSRAVIEMLSENRKCGM